ncbi:MAG: SMC-Scp complex subunit ScpB [Candidatus Nanoarchaeia archaeon]|nr:SMC-Scp complex subunit ScpB [Candidatus Nanoarchaeia archaeon]MDD5239361.1 SMC-Scp complex subunit ScpB [Candidatus Nanoarchaeia archaeon]
MSQEEKETQQSVKQKAEIEAVLFATNGLTVAEISKRTGITEKTVKDILEELELEHMNNVRGIHVLQEGDIWKMSIKPEMTVFVKDLLPPEFPKALMKTLAIIAAKKPVKQSVIVRIRGNKAYEQVKKLIRLGFVTSEKFGSTMMLDLTQKFFDYFQLRETEIPEKFKLDSETEAAVKRAEKEAEEEEKKAENGAK